ncbi:MAG: hypothetical protein ACK5CT_04135, partial [Bacteroidota bacterium]
MTSVCSTATNIGNFGIDGDLFPNTNPGTIFPDVSDDWFANPAFPGFGSGIIGTSAATSVPAGTSAAAFNSLIQNGPTLNRTYVQRMAFPPLFPVVNPTTLSGYILLDAVAGRDYTSADGADTTSFTISAKNWDNPSTWQIGAGGVQPKNDILDAGGHIRRAYYFGDFTTPLDDAAGDLYGYAFATRRSNNGDAYIDFEIFRTAPVIAGGGLTNTGTDGGHTATRFATGGTLLEQPGDVLVSIDFSNGGTQPCASIRVWIDPTNVDGNGMTIAAYNALPPSQRIYTFTGVFNSGDQSGSYGYAEIVPVNASVASCLFVAVTNTGGTQPAGPWGTITSNGGAYTTTHDVRTVCEVAINFSAFGLDIAPASGPCFNLFGSLAVKTRASASPSSNLADFSGPYIFGNFQEVNADAGENMNISCNVTEVTLMGSSTTPGASYLWTIAPGSTGNIVSGATTANPVVDQAGTYILTVSNPTLASCVAADTVEVFGEPDTSAPVVDCLPNITRTCLEEVPAAPFDAKTFTEQGGTITDISGPVTVTHVDSPVVTSSCNQVVNRTFTFTDNCGNSSTCTQVITINDNIAPIISGPADANLGCNPTIPAADLSLITASDNCIGSVVKSVEADVITGGCDKTLTRRYLATDACGNVADHIQTFTYRVDLSAPVLTNSNASVTNGGSADLGCNPGAQDIEDAFGTVTASDDCDAAVAVIITDGTIVSNGCLRSKTRSWSASDICSNNTSAFSYTVNWKEDTQAPLIILNGTQGATPDLGCNPTTQEIEDALGSASVADNCDNLSVSSNDGADQINGCSYSRTRTFTAQDECGNNAIAVVRTVSWKVDTDAPVITHNDPSLINGGNEDLGCNPTASDIEGALGSATVADNCDASITLNVNDGPVQTNGCINSKTRTWSASDACGNNATSFATTVTWKADTTTPTITLDGPQGANPSIGCNPSAQDIEDALGTASVSDACDNTLTATATDSPVQSNGCSRSKTRTFTVTDLCGNAATPVVRTVSWTEDTTAPIINLTGGTANAGCNPSNASILASFPTATVADACGPLTATFTDSPDTPNGCSMSRTRTWNVSDACGNAAQPVSFIVTWSTDTVAPVISASGTTLTLGCNPSAQDIEAALGSATANDACGTITPTEQTSPITINGCERSQTRSWTAVDGCGNNSVSAVRTITWKVDTIAPVIQASGTTNDAGCNPTTIELALALGSATVTDECDNLTATINDSPVSINGCMREQTRTWTVADGCGNNATSVSRTITWKIDTDAPVVNCSVNGILTVCDGNTINFTSSATDNCDGNVAVTCVRSDGLSVSNPFPTGTTTVTCTAVDACGNTGTCNATINVLANPTCDIPTPQVIPQCGSTGNQLSATATNATTYSWSVASPGGVVDPWVITSGANTSTITYTAGNGPAVFTLTVTNEQNGQECISQCQISMTCGGGDRFCTYTQGYYGNQGGRNCTGGRTTDLLLTQLATPLIIGDTAIDKSLTLTAADVTSGCVYLRLPGGGTAAQLNGDATCSTPTGIALKSNGTFRNILLAQTITLGLNLRVPGSTLGGLAITDKYLVTYASSSGACADTNAVPVAGTAIVRMIPGAIINYL